MDDSMRFWLSILSGTAAVAAVLAGMRRIRSARVTATDPWPVAIMGDLREFDTVRVCRLAGSPESHLAMSDTGCSPVIGDEGVVMDWLQQPGIDPQARIIVESEEWLAVFRRDELELVSRASKEPPAD
jgi:hypothetical protein